MINIVYFFSYRDLTRPNPKLGHFYACFQDKMGGYCFVPQTDVKLDEVDSTSAAPYTPHGRAIVGSPNLATE